MTARHHALRNAAIAKREARAAAHAAMMERQTVRRNAIALYETALTMWQDAGYVGPAPLDPRYYDRVMFPENFLSAA